MGQGESGILSRRQSQVICSWSELPNPDKSVESDQTLPCQNIGVIAAFVRINIFFVALTFASATLMRAS